jgi:hypothetical protein
VTTVINHTDKYSFAVEYVQPSLTRV